MGGGKPEFGQIDAQTKKLGRGRMNEVNASVHWCIDPSGGDKPELGKIDAQTKKLGRARVNEVHASKH